VTPRERVLLALTIAGFVVPDTMATVFFMDHGLDLSGFFDGFVPSLPAALLAADLSIAFLAFALWAAWEGRRIGMRTWWLPIPASALVGLCFAIPLFLLLRERALRERPPSLGLSGASSRSTNREADTHPASA
jgi:hypothetical protein